MECKYGYINDLIDKCMSSMDDLIANLSELYGATFQDYTQTGSKVSNKIMNSTNDLRTTLRYLRTDYQKDIFGGNVCDQD